MYHDTISKIEIIILVQMVLFRHGKAVLKKKTKFLFIFFFTAKHFSYILSPLRPRINLRNQTSPISFCQNSNHTSTFNLAIDKIIKAMKVQTHQHNFFFFFSNSLVSSFPFLYSFSHHPPIYLKKKMNHNIIVYNRHQNLYPEIHKKTFFFFILKIQ